MQISGSIIIQQCILEGCHLLTKRIRQHRYAPESEYWKVKGDGLRAQLAEEIAGRERATLKTMLEKATASEG